MARRKTIGILNAIVTADAAQLRREFKSADNTIRRSTTAWQKQLKGGLKLGLGIVGAQSVISALVQEVQHVIANVEKIPGIPAETITSVQDLRSGLAQMRNEADRNIAKFIHLAAIVGKSIGAGAAMLAGADEEDIVAGLTKLDSPDDIAAAEDSAYWEKVEAARQRLVETNRKAALAGMTDAGQIAELRAEAERYHQFAQSSSINALQRLDAETEAAERTASANQKLAAMKRELAEAEQKLGAASFGAARAKTDDAQAAAFLQDKIMQLQTELAALNSLMAEQADNPHYLAAAIEKTNELTEANKQLEKVLDRQDKKWAAAGEAVATSFGEAVLAGGNLREMLASIEQDILRVVLRTAIIEPLGKWLGGGLKSLFGGFFAEGGRPPVGRVSVVGEEGPELFVPDAAGTVVPNHALAASPAGATYYIDARGADATGLARLEAMIRTLHGSIEPRALAAVMDHRRRGAFA
jgi:predicted  nucleic acid-binding Zn-ribbon protein